MPRGLPADAPCAPARAMALLARALRVVLAIVTIVACGALDTPSHARALLAIATERAEGDALAPASSGGWLSGDTRPAADDESALEADDDDDDDEDDPLLAPFAAPFEARLASSARPPARGPRPGAPRWKSRTASRVGLPRGPPA